MISDRQVLLWGWKLSYVLRYFSSCELQCFLSSAANEMSLCDHKEAELEEQVPGREMVVLGPRRCPWAGLLPWPVLSQESHLGSCSGNSEGLLVVVWYSCAMGATLEELGAVFIFKATIGSSLHKCLGKALVWSESIDSHTFLQKSVRFEF